MAAVAARYARALADVAFDPKAASGGVDVLRAQLRSFGEAWTTSADLRNVLTNPAVPPARKRALLERLGQPLGLNRIALNFLFVLVDHRRIGLFDQVLASFDAIVDERLGIVRADVATPAALNDSERQLMEQALRSLTGKQVRVHYEVDPSLIGGAVTRIGSTVYDGSVREQLRLLKEQLGS